VIQLFTREGEGAPSLETTLSAGSYGDTRRTSTPRASW
jgi:iron complex outermembrane receptor protein